MYKLDLKDAYFSVPLHQDSSKLITFQWKTKVYQCLCLCFGLGPTPKVFTKLMKVPIALLRKLDIRLIIFLDNILIMVSTKEDILMAKDTLVFLLQNLGFIINSKKSVFNPTQTLQFLGMEINSVEMILSFPLDEKETIVSQCQGMLSREVINIRELTQLLGRLTASAMAILPAPLQYQAMQRQQIWELSRQDKGFESKIKLSSETVEEIRWWIQNLHLNNGKCLLTGPPQAVITSDASIQGWGAACRGIKTGDRGLNRRGRNISMFLELKAARFAILTFTVKFLKLKYCLLLECLIKSQLICHGR